MVSVGDVSERVGRTLGHLGIIPLDLALHLLALIDDESDERGEHRAKRDQQHAVAPVYDECQRQQHDQRDETGKVLAEEGEPQAPQRIGAGHHHLNQPAGMRADIVAQRKLQHVLEKHGSHRLILAVSETVGVKRHQSAGDDCEKTKADPGADQHHQIRPGQFRQAPLRVRERIDNASEQDGLDEHGGRQHQIGDRERPAHAGLAPEQLEHAHIEANEFHRPTPAAGLSNAISGANNAGTSVVMIIAIATEAHMAGFDRRPPDASVLPHQR
jgi:hypothetical protein